MQSLKENGSLYTLLQVSLIYIKMVLKHICKIMTNVKTQHRPLVQKCFCNLLWWQHFHLKFKITIVISSYTVIFSLSDFFIICYKAIEVLTVQTSDVLPAVLQKNAKKSK